MNRLAGKTAIVTKAGHGIGQAISRNPNSCGSTADAINAEFPDSCKAFPFDVLSRFKNEDAALLMELERQCAGRLIFRSDPSIHREAFAILNPANNNKPLFQINM